MAGRNGVRHDTSAAKEKFPEVEGQTRDIAAAKAGLMVEIFPPLHTDGKT